MRATCRDGMQVVSIELRDESCITAISLNKLRELVYGSGRRQFGRVIVPRG